MKRIAASLTFFTRLPVWRFMDIPSESYSTVVVFWPLTGWVTGSLTALLLWLAAMALPMLPAVVIALCGRTIFTGALHEDGLADFCDGFGGGRSSEQILSIMKDSHIGTYGVVGLIFYYFLFATLVSSLPFWIAMCGVLASDAFSKTCAGQLTNLLPYARPEGAKNRISYQHMTPIQLIVAIIAGLLPVGLLAYRFPLFALSIIFPMLSSLLFGLYLRRKIGGYTGDCCGAAFLICEISMLTGITILYHLI